MSDTAFRKVVGQAIVDLEYRELLFNDPDKALEGLDLTSDESTILKNFKRDKFDEVANEMEDRISRAGALNLKGFAAMANCF